jgi:hypothetical protein
MYGEAMSMKRSAIRWGRAALLAAALAACSTTPDAPDLPLGDRLESDMKDDGTWGSALTCKTIPSFPRLVSPRITISLNGLTLHLVDPATGFDKVFPVGVGAIDKDTTQSTFGESLTYYPTLATGKNDFTLVTANIQPCKTWWTDPDTGQKSPVFAGLPFMPFYGGYAMHGPIDNFRAPNGGNLRRGFVSHGCVRMEAADVLEVYARVRGVARVPVHLQREPERDASGARIDLAQRWIGAECTDDSDCNFAGGFCKANPYSERGYCTARCTSTCADRAGAPTTFCVADPDDATQGICTFKTGGQMPDCRAADHFVAVTRSRFHQTVQAPVCLPGSPGWVGDHCFAAIDCKAGLTCGGASGSSPGLCTQPCARVCPDQPGWPQTFCSREASVASSATCLRVCTPASNASECPGGTACVSHTRESDPGTAKYVCVPM